MMLIEIDGNWINPARIVAVVPGKRRGIDECEILMTDGHFVRINRTADAVVGITADAVVGIIDEKTRPVL